MIIFKTIRIAITSLPLCNFVSLFPPLSYLFISFSLLPPLPSYLSLPSSFIPVRAWLPRFCQFWQVKQQGRRSGSNAKLLACWRKKNTHSSQLFLWRFLSGLLILHSSRDIRFKMRLNSLEGKHTLKIALKCLLQLQLYCFNCFKITASTLH